MFGLLLRDRADQAQVRELVRDLIWLDHCDDSHLALREAALLRLYALQRQDQQCSTCGGLRHR